MKKTEQEPRWVAGLRQLMAAQGLNPRSLSLKAGLNPTAVRDMLEGRVKFPRYDTVESLAQALCVTPAQLMGGHEPETKTNETGIKAKSADPLAEEDLNILTEIITRLQEVAEDYRHTLEPKEFAAMVATIYRQIKPEPQQTKRNVLSGLTPKIQNLMDYERLRRRSASGKK